MGTHKATVKPPEAQDPKIRGDKTTQVEKFKDLSGSNRESTTVEDETEKPKVESRRTSVDTKLKEATDFPKILPEKAQITPEKTEIEKKDRVEQTKEPKEEVEDKSKEVEKSRDSAEKLREAKGKGQERQQPKVDPFEFEEDPVEIPPKMTSSILKDRAVDQGKSNPDEVKESGSVEIVEVVMDEEAEKDPQYDHIEEIVHSSRIDLEDEVIWDEGMKEEKTSSPSTDSAEQSEEKESSSDSKGEMPRTFTPEFVDDFDIEVTKLNKIGKAKRDYSRTKKKEETFDILLDHTASTDAEDEIAETLSEKAETLSEQAETLSEKAELYEKAESYEKSYEKGDGYEKSGSYDKAHSYAKTDPFEKAELYEKSEYKVKIKSETDRSNSPWTEEEEPMRTRRRYSTPATPIDSIPNSPASGTAYEDDREYRNWKKSVMLFYSRLSTHKYASLFLKPITNEQAPGYHNIIYRPMDLQTIRKNVENGVVRTTAEFQRDVLLMFNNAIMYNKTNEHVYNMARQMQQECLEQIQILLQAQADIPVRRETRTSEPAGKRTRGSHDEPMRKKRKED